MGFVIVVAGRIFSDSTGMRLRSQNMLNSAEEAGKVSAILKEDVSQMGAKSWGVSSASFDTAAVVHYNFNNGDFDSPSTDFSSFELDRSDPLYDVLRFRKIYYNEKGACGDAVEIEWSVTDSVLARKCQRLNVSKCDDATFDESVCPDSVEMARNVAEFKLLPSKPGTEDGTGTLDTLFPASSASSFSLITNGTTSGAAFPGANKVILSGFTQNSSASSEYLANFYLAEDMTGGCSEFELLAGEEYAIDFNLLCLNSACRNVSIDEKYNPMVMFQPGNDHLSVGLRDPDMNGEPIVINGVRQPDFLFYPPQNTTANKARHFEFSVPEAVTACIGITAAFYSPAAAGRLEIEKFKVYRKTDNVYHFDRSSSSTYNPSVGSDKASVKAFELTLGINKRGEISRIATVIPAPNNGVVSGGY